MPINGKPTYYEFMGLENFESDMSKIKSAYRGMALKWHPDRCENKEDADRMMKQINEIWDVLLKNKESYDTYLRKKLMIAHPQEQSVYFNSRWETTDSRTFTFKYSFSDERIKQIKLKTINIILNTMNESELNQVEIFAHRIRKI